MNKKKTSSDLYKQIIEFTPSKAEEEREAQRQKAISDKYAEINTLTAEGNRLIRGIDAGTMFTGDYPNADRVKAIQREIKILRNNIRTLSRMPIQDDAFIACSQELEEITAKRKEAEERYFMALQEREQSAGSVPFDLYKSLEKECYSLSEQAQKLRKRESELTDKLKQYERKTDRLFSEYSELKDAETKEFLRSQVKGLYDYLEEVITEKDHAEEVTLGRKGMTPEQVDLYMVPYGGDLYRRLLKYLSDIIELVQE